MQWSVQLGDSFVDKLALILIDCRPYVQTMKHKFCPSVTEDPGGPAVLAEASQDQAIQAVQAREKVALPQQEPRRVMCAVRDCRIQLLSRPS